MSGLRFGVLLSDKPMLEMFDLLPHGGPGWAVLLASAYLQKPESSAGVNQRAASDWSVVIISTLPFSLTWSRGEYLRVVGILEMVE